LPVTGKLPRGSLIERTVRHTRGCTICTGGGGRPLWVLTVGYAGGRTRQLSLRREQSRKCAAGWATTTSSRRRSKRSASSTAGCCARMTPPRGARGQGVIETHRAQRSFGDGLIAAEVKGLHETWMRQSDQVLSDNEIVTAVYEALAQRHPQSRKRGRPGGPVEVVLRLLVLKHMRNRSHGLLEREVRVP
jgi:hypothetical protein